MRHCGLCSRTKLSNTAKYVIFDVNKTSSRYLIFQMVQVRWPSFVLMGLIFEPKSILFFILSIISHNNFQVIPTSLFLDIHILLYVGGNMLNYIATFSNGGFSNTPKTRLDWISNGSKLALSRLATAPRERWRGGCYPSMNKHRNNDGIKSHDSLG